MNYRHAFHAGNFGDVLKHVVLLQLLSHLCAKDSPFHLLDSHAGLGLYDLASSEAQRGGEYRQGVGAVLADKGAAAALPDYVAALRRLNPDLAAGGAGLRYYPGSPWLMADALRADDRLSLVELHPEDSKALKRNMGRDPRIHVHQRDAYEALKALLPPQPRRGLALIDPAFEAKDEFERLTKALIETRKRWATGILAVWYPIKARAATDAWAKGVAKTVPGPILRIELLVRAAKDAERFNGSGLLIFNPPWKFEKAMAAPLAFLKSRLCGEPGGGTRLDWLVPPEKA